MLRVPRVRTIFKLLPVALPVLIFIGGGISLTILQSAGKAMPVATPFQGADAYKHVLTDAWFIRSFLYSCYVALAAASISVVLGTLLAYGIWRLPRQLSGFGILYKIPLILPHVVVAYLVMLIFSNSGVLASLAFKIGLIETPAEFPSILYGGTGAGIILAYVYKETSFVALLASGVLQRIDPKLILTARNLGGSRTAIFRRIILPYLFPALSTSFLILFLYSLGAFDIPYLLSESRPEMISVQIYSLYFQRDLSLRPVAMASLVILFLIACGFIALYMRVARSLDRRVRKL